MPDFRVKSIGERLTIYEPRAGMLIREILTKKYGIFVILGFTLLQACSQPPGNQISGKYCMIIERAPAEQCIYLKPDGSATFNNFGVLVDMSWEFLDQNSIKIVGEQTGSGLMLSLSPDRRDLVGLSGLLRYTKVGSP